MENIQNKPLFASLVAVMLAMMLAMSGVGLALGAPNDENNKFRYEEESQAVNVPAGFSKNCVVMNIEGDVFTCDFLYQDPCDSVYLDYSINGTRTVLIDLSAASYSSYTKEDKNRINTGFTYTLDLNTLDLSKDDVITFNGY